MPWDRRKYPAGWPAVRAAVRTRAENRREALMANGSRCNAPNGELIVRNPRDREQWQPLSEPPETCWGGYVVRVVLTTAHLPEAENEMDVRLHVLASYCQLHHLRLDAGLHARNAALTRRKRRIEAGQASLEITAST